jgi:hypothetical protein
MSIKKYFITTFGCQMNESDSERYAGLKIKRRAETLHKWDRRQRINKQKHRQGGIFVVLAFSFGNP